jgi:hypothetical protein
MLCVSVPDDDLRIQPNLPAISPTAHDVVRFGSDGDLSGWPAKVTREEEMETPRFRAEMPEPLGL